MYEYIGIWICTYDKHTACHTIFKFEYKMGDRHTYSSCKRYEQLRVHKDILDVCLYYLSVSSIPVPMVRLLANKAQHVGSCNDEEGWS